MRIGRYQLENLVREGIRFLFADLRTPEQRAQFDDPLLVGSIALSAEELHAKLEGAAPDSAVLLLSQDGSEAASVADSLESKGFKNVYIVRDGVASLRS
jgi:rhodanese-related sulfurtransferase